MHIDQMNEVIIEKLHEIADLLELQNANHYRISAYRHAAITLGQLKTSVNDIVFHQGIAGLTELPAIGEGIARLIYEYVATDDITRLEVLKGQNDPITMLMKIPGIGKNLANFIFEKLHIASLEELEQAAYDGRLVKLNGIGEYRLQGIKLWLDTIIGKRQYQSLVRILDIKPDIGLILSIDQKYRHAASENMLPKITPKRFNKNNEAWLPIMHTSQNDWHFTVLFSNSYLAHKLDKNLDWVIVYYYDKSHRGGQCTVVTEYRGESKGRRVIRGRELECNEYYSNYVIH